MKSLFIIFFCITFFSCSKDPNTPSGTTASGSIQYKVNGNLMVIDNVDILSGQYVTFAKQLKGSIISETRYVLNAQKGANNIFVFIVETDSLKLLNYHYDNTFHYALSFVMGYNGQDASLYSTQDYFDIIITSYKDSRISATFTAKFTPYTMTGFGQPGATVITEGEIKNVQVIY